MTMLADDGSDEILENVEDAIERSPLRVYRRTRSHLRFAWRHAPGALARLHRRFARDVAWLVLKPTGPDRVRAARAILAALRDYHVGRTGAGPAWIWRAR